MKDYILDSLAAGSDEAVSRRGALRKLEHAGLGLLAAAVPSVLANAAGAATRSPSRVARTQTVTDVLNFALKLEYLENEFYLMGLAASGLIPSGDRVIFQQISAHETAHVALLKGALGGSAIVKPTFDFTAGGAFSDVFTNYITFKALSQGFEDTGVRAYKGQAVNLKSDGATLTIALQIHSVEARHASQVRRLRGQKGWITSNNTDVSALAAVYAGEDNHVQGGVDVGSTSAATEAFDEPLTMVQVLAIAGPFIV